MDIPPSDLPTIAVGDSFSFTNPKETWTVISVQGGLITWRSTRGAEKTTAFDPFLPTLQWVSKNGDAGVERLVRWDSSLFPLKGGNKNAFQSERIEKGETAATPFVWKCYVGNPRKVMVKAGSFPAYPVFCRRSDDLTVQYFYAPDINAPLLVTTRKRPAPAETRELVRFKLADGERIAASALPGLPKGWAQAAPPRVARTAVQTGEATTMTARTPAQDRIVAARPDTKESPDRSAQEHPHAPPTIAPSPGNLPPGAGRQSAATQSGKASHAAVPKIAAPVPVPTQPAAADHRPDARTRSSRPRFAVAAPATSKRTSRSFGVQIASFQHSENVEKGWPHYVARLKPLLDGIDHSVQQVNLGAEKAVFHRLIAGRFPTRAGAESLCKAIRNHGADCLVTAITN